MSDVTETAKLVLGEVARAKQFTETKQIGEIFTNLLGERRQLPKKTRRTERGDLLDGFLGRLNPPRAKDGFPPITRGRLNYLLAGIPTADLYALQSKCDDAERRGYPWSAIFWKEIRPEQTNV